VIDERTKQLIRRTLLERISLEGVRRVFDVSMPWLLEFIDSLIYELPEDLNAEYGSQRLNRKAAKIIPQINEP
jgi:hypothetical protein